MPGKAFRIHRRSVPTLALHATNTPSAGDAPLANADGTYTWTAPGSASADSATLQIAVGAFHHSPYSPTLWNDRENVLANRIFGPATIAPDVQAGTNITVTRNAQGFVVNSTFSTTVDDASLQIAGSAFHHQPAVPDVRAGSNVTVTRDAGGYVVSSSSSLTAWDDRDNIIANKVYGA